MNTNPFLAALATMTALNTKPEKEAVVRAGRTAQVLTPTGMALRLFKDGRVYPSQELVDHFSLAYVAKDEDVKNDGNGLDVFLAHDLPNFDKSIPNTILVAPVAKSEPKVSLFKSTEYNEDGTPKSSVLEQGSNTFGKASLIGMVETVLSKESSEIFANQKFVDLEVEVEYQLPLAGEFLYIPKVQSRGEDKGKVSLIRRNSATVFPITVLYNQEEQILAEQEATSEDNQVETKATTTAPELHSTL